MAAITARCALVASIDDVFDIVITTSYPSFSPGSKVERPVAIRAFSVVCTAPSALRASSSLVRASLHLYSKDRALERERDRDREDRQPVCEQEREQERERERESSAEGERERERVEVGEEVILILRKTRIRIVGESL